MKENILSEIKKRFEPLQKKYNLPSFSELNKDFEIEKIQEHETEFILREIRQNIGEKIGAFLRFLETILNPVMAPMFVLNSLKNLGNRDKELIKKCYEVLAEIEIIAVSLDINYDEKEEAVFIKKAFKKWQEVKPDFKEIMGSVSKAQFISDEKKKSYLG